jgi:small-conductance mechanosensitive channel
MGNWIQLVGPQHALQIFGIRFVGVDLVNAKKLLFSVVLVVALLVLRRVLGLLARKSTSLRYHRFEFWLRQTTSIAVALIGLIGLLSIWFDNPARLTTAVGLVSAGLAFALQRVVTAFAGYLLILRGNTFHVGDRIVMGAVRGDVIAIGFLQTTIMEMGQPPSVQSADPDMWVKGRQYSGRLVSVTNAKVFDDAVYNYSRDFPYIWDEMSLPVSYNSNWTAARQILLDAAKKHAANITQLSEASLTILDKRFALNRAELEPSVFIRLTDNWIELSLRFLVQTHGVREVKSRMSADILAGFDQMGLSVASGTYDIVGFPPVRVEMVDKTGAPASQSS